MLNKTLLSYCRMSHHRNYFKRCGLVVKHLVAKTNNTGDATRYFSTHGPRKRVLGIETSCDDTGAAVVDDMGNILGEALHSQTATHIELGGILPTVARDLHKENIENVVNTALSNASVRLEDLDAVAVTVKPGLPLSLSIGLNHAKKLVRESRVPMIPIHHMEAHALTARMLHWVEFPFLVLLMSGGHCLLAVAKDVEEFLLLGTCLDDSPGDAFDKTARRLKTKNLPECTGLSGGESIELLAQNGNPEAFPGPQIRRGYKDCHFTFSSIKSHFKKLAEEEEIKYGIEGGGLLPNIADICASFQYCILRNLARRTQRALLFCEMKGLLLENKTLVISGGVASNKFLRSGLQRVCEELDCSIICPPPHLCTDNGIMIAWNGMEKLLAGRGVVDDPESVQFLSRSPLGTDISEQVAVSTIKLPKLNLLP